MNGGGPSVVERRQMRSDRVYDGTDRRTMSDCSVHVKWKDLADELMRQDSRLLGQCITRSCTAAESDALIVFKITMSHRIRIWRFCDFSIAHIDRVTQHRGRLVLRLLTVRWYTILVHNQPSRLTQPPTEYRSGSSGSDVMFSYD